VEAANIAPVAVIVRCLNPDQVERLKKGSALNEADMNTFYGGGA
jgi:hypothetical protein